MERELAEAREGARLLGPRDAAASSQPGGGGPVPPDARSGSDGGGASFGGWVPPGVATLLAAGGEPGVRQHAASLAARQAKLQARVRVGESEHKDRRAQRRVGVRGVVWARGAGGLGQRGVLPRSGGQAGIQWRGRAGTFATPLSSQRRCGMSVQPRFPRAWSTPPLSLPRLSTCTLPCTPPPSFNPSPHRGPQLEELCTDVASLQLAIVEAQDEDDEAAAAAVAAAAAAAAGGGGGNGGSCGSAAGGPLAPSRRDEWWGCVPSLVLARPALRLLLERAAEYKAAYQEALGRADSLEHQVGAAREAKTARRGNKTCCRDG